MLMEFFFKMYGVIIIFPIIYMLTNICIYNKHHYYNREQYFLYLKQNYMLIGIKKNYFLKKIFLNTIVFVMIKLFSIMQILFFILCVLCNYDYNFKSIDNNNLNQLTNTQGVNISETNILETNILETDILETNILGTNILETNILETNILETNNVEPDLFDMINDSKININNKICIEVDNSKNINLLDEIKTLNVINDNINIDELTDYLITNSEDMKIEDIKIKDINFGFKINEILEQQINMSNNGLSFNKPTTDKKNTKKIIKIGKKNKNTSLNNSTYNLTSNI